VVQTTLFIESVGAIGDRVTDPSLGDAGVLLVSARELVAGLVMNLVVLAILLVTVVQAIWMTVAVPDERNAPQTLLALKLISGARRGCRRRNSRRVGDGAVTLVGGVFAVVLVVTFPDLGNAL
jgi:hypothetical protein